MARPRSISEEDTLERALRLFWEHGYDRTSIADLSEAIGVGPSSLYNTFGSKEQLYQRAIERYMQTYGSFAGALLAGEQQESAVEFTRVLLRGAVKLYTTEGQPCGCAMFQSSGAGSPRDSVAAAYTQGIKLELQQGLQARFEGFARGGEELSAGPRVLANFVLGSMRGISQLASDGTSRSELYKVAELAARSVALPG